jgi:hypothetical protein
LDAVTVCGGLVPDRESRSMAKKRATPGQMIARLRAAEVLIA